MGEMLRLADNPLFLKHVRSRLRRSAMLPTLILVGFLCCCLLFVDLWFRFMSAPPNPNLYPFCYFILVGMQGLILYILGGSQVSSSVAYVKDSGILDYHRITPIPARVQAIGFILGAPIREYILFIITLPFSFALAMLSDVGISGFSKIFLVMVGATVLNHTIAFLVGLSAKTSRAATGRYFGILAMIWFGTNAISGMALMNAEQYHGPTLISPYPVVREVINEVLFKNAPAANVPPPNNFVKPQPAQNKGAAVKQNPFGAPVQPGFNPNANPLFFANKAEPKLFGIEIPLVLQTLLAQGTLLTFLFIGATRRIHSARISIFSKLEAVAFFGAVNLFAIATLWKIPVEGLVIANVYGLMILAIVMIGLCTQTRGELMRGYQRALKQGRKVPRTFDDLASNHGAILSIGAILGAFAIFHYNLMAGVQVAAQAPRVESYVYGFAVALGAIVSVGFLIQYCKLRYPKRWSHRLGFFMFFIWFAPMLLALISSVIGNGNSAISQMFLALSPIVSLPMVILIDRVGAAVNMGTEEFRAIAIGAVFFESILFLLISVRAERRLRSEALSEHEEDHRQLNDPEYEVELD
ncbi:hypothetical protein KIH39_07175 [Telmatocola sphagniphila]|uniref:Uncharacterized protein n=1 Tax=Telmatocola sphagniphila TaxID=1123043 RepID=A0A8E6EZF0_9BACT|nr:hypothetical protein [Telmatocola sphagniphila]QVL33683.1 hypothetical protein KIH39_07175 [Telmatocola sphagniphila]